MTTSYIYFLYEVDSDNVKVGKSNCPRTRVQQLEDNIDLEKSYCVEAEEKLITKIEKALHRTFQLTKHWIQDRPRRDGHTEWYDLEGVEKIKKYLTDTFDFKEFLPLPEVMTPEHKKCTEKIKKNNRYLVEALEELTNYDETTYQKEGDYFLIFQKIDSTCNFQYTEIERYTQSKYQYLHNNYYVETSLLCKKSMIIEDVLVTVINDIRDDLPEDFQDNTKEWARIEELFKIIEDNCILPEKASQKEEGLQKEITKVHERIKNISNKEQELSDLQEILRNKERFFGKNPNSEYVCEGGEKYKHDNFVIKEDVVDGTFSIWSAKLDSENNLIGTDDWPWVDTGIQEEFTSKDRMLYLLEFLYGLIKNKEPMKKEDIDKLPKNIEEREALRRRLSR